MAKAKKYDRDTTEEWDLYEDGVKYKSSINLYRTVDENYRYYLGDQWRGVKSNGLPTPVYNFIKPVVRYKVATIMATETKVIYSATNDRDKGYGELAAAADTLTRHAENIWEQRKLDYLGELVVLDAAITGNGIAYWYYDEEEKEAKCDLIDSVNIFPADVNDPEIQSQAYLMISYRKSVGEVKAEAKQARDKGYNALTDEEVDSIASDTDSTYEAGDFGKRELDTKDDASKCLCLLKLWKEPETGTVWMKKSTRSLVYFKSSDTGQKLYPVSHMVWEPVKNSFFGWPDVAGMIPNQQYANKIAAMMMLHTMYSAFPKMVYDADKVDNPSNQIGVEIAVHNSNGQPVKNLIDFISPASMSPDAFNMFNATIQKSRELMGAGDAALGLVNPEQASGKAIVATTEASATPLESIRRRYYNYIEDAARIWFDLWSAHSEEGKTVVVKNADGKEEKRRLSAATIEKLRVSVKVDVGPDSRFSAQALEKTLDTLLANKYITFEEWIKLIPDNSNMPKKQLENILRQRQSAPGQKAGAAAAGGQASPLAAAAMMPGGGAASGGGGMPQMQQMPQGQQSAPSQSPTQQMPQMQQSGKSGTDPVQAARALEKMQPAIVYSVLEKLQTANPQLAAQILQNLKPEFLAQLKGGRTNGNRQVPSVRR